MTTPDGGIDSEGAETRPAASRRTLMIVALIVVPLVAAMIGIAPEVWDLLAGPPSTPVVTATAATATVSASPTTTPAVTTASPVPPTTPGRVSSPTPAAVVPVAWSFDLGPEVPHCSDISGRGTKPRTGRAVLFIQREAEQK
jgi:hypothetical protein